MMLAVGEDIIKRIAAQGALGLAKGCLNPGEKYMAEYMVSKGILGYTRVDGVMFLKLVSKPFSAGSIN